MICQEETAQDLSDRVREQEEAWVGEDRAVVKLVDKDQAQDRAASAYAPHVEREQRTSRARPAHKQNALNADSPWCGDNTKNKIDLNMDMPVFLPMVAPIDL